MDDTVPDEVKTLVDHKPRRCKDRRKFMCPIFGSEKGSHNRHEPVKAKQVNYNRKPGRKFKVYVSSFFLLMTCFFVQQKPVTQFSYAVSIYRGLLKKCSSESTFVIVNRDRALCVRQLFHERGYNRVQLLLKT